MSIYNVEIQNHGNTGENRLSLSRDGLIVKAEYHVEDEPNPITSTHDCDHVTSPASPAPVRTK